MGKDNPISNIQCPKVLPQPQLNKLHPRSRSQSRRLFIRFILSQDSSDLRLKPLPESQNCLRISERRLESTDKPMHKVILYPVTSDKNVQRMENENILTFIVALNANKSHIKKSFETLLSVKVRSVNTMIRPDGKKKAYIRLAQNHDSLKVASKIGIL